MKTATTTYEHIALDDQGVPVIAGANTKVIEIVSIQRAYAKTPQEIAAGLPHLSVAQVEAALEYCEAHRQEIDEDIERRVEKVERMREEMGQPAFVAKLRRTVPGGFQAG